MVWPSFLFLDRFTIITFSINLVHLLSAKQVYLNCIIGYFKFFKLFIKLKIFTDFEKLLVVDKIRVSG